ncbi:hypothetical protein SAMN02745784_01247 [Tissierella praeacuta DSM 18095]|uniref:Antirestriction protein (ArdA) n=1 Tax=Tissierella praeacuta DSM 18095 TaxID=1123404 RepID=A0A1M4UXR1_9FIRM|nr:hypothetical protein [Tissierella praeacuta]SHE61465.1 hypothetical protein SAMN02745784_01247 [Tissierella praeacuta DSM 18095]SUP02680.1 Uncharacterised protein [Tissierella praeacuta]
MRDLIYMWKRLEGTEEEKAYLDRRFNEMSVKEQYVLEGAIQIIGIYTATDMINLTEQLSSFDFYYKATDEKSLGEYVAKYKEDASDEILPFIKTEKLGREYHEDFQGSFTNEGYIIQRNTIKQIYDGTNLDKMTGGDWTVKLKVSSKSNPEGVWINLADYEFSTLEPDEIAIALDVLGIDDWKEANLLDAKCIFSNITELQDQYDSIEKLIIDGNNLGYACDEQDQGKDFYMEHLESAMELEGCTRLDFALDISQNLDCYDFIPRSANLEKYGRIMAERDGIVELDSILGDNFDYVRYAKVDIEKKELDPCKHGFIKRNEEKFYYEFSKEPDSINLSME